MSCRQMSRPFSTIQQGNRVRKLFLICPQTINKLLHEKGYSYQSIYSFEQCWIVGPHAVAHLEYINLCPQTIKKLLHEKGYLYQSIYSFEQCWIVGPHGVGHLEHINLHETQPDNRGEDREEIEQDPEYQDGEEGIIMN